MTGGSFFREQVCFIQESGHMPDNSYVSDVLKLSASCWPNWDAKYAERLIRHYELPIKKRVTSLSRGMKSALGVTIGLASLGWIFFEYFCLFFAYFGSGWLIGSGFYRFDWKIGILISVAALLPAMAMEIVLSSDWIGKLLQSVVNDRTYIACSRRCSCPSCDGMHRGSELYDASPCSH